MTQPMTVAALQALRAEIAQDRIVLLPLRLFIGIGWLRACLEKALDPAWWNGHALSAWLTHHLAASPYPAYAALMAHLFRPHALGLGLLVMALQLLVGLGIFTGAYTRPALLAGIVLNLNFVAAGAPTPSAFYLVIQLVLLTGGAGLVFGLDRLRARRRQRALTFTPSPYTLPGMVVLLLPLTALGGLSLRYARNFSVGGSVGDPAILLAVTAFFAAGCLLIGVLRAALNGAVLPQRSAETAAPSSLEPLSLYLQPGTEARAEGPDLWSPVQITNPSAV